MVLIVSYAPAFDIEAVQCDNGSVVLGAPWSRLS